jgi:hypothetical protein
VEVGLCIEEAGSFAVEIGLSVDSLVKEVDSLIVVPAACFFSTSSF